MRNRRIQAVVIALAALAATATVTACTQRTEGTPAAISPSDQPTIGSPTVDDPVTSIGREEGDESGDGTSSEPGSGSDDGSGIGQSPYDPCVVVSWEDFPAEARPEDPSGTPPVEQQSSSQVTFTAACLWTGASAVTLIAWGEPPAMSAEPTGATDEKVTQIGGRPALLKMALNEDLSEVCGAFVDIGDQGTVAVATQSASSDIDVCVVATQVAEMVTERVS